MKSGFVSIFGKPSVGKSSLMNAILGTKLSIVSPKQQTTWYNILGVLNKKDAQVCFVDTPGYHKVSKSKLNKYLVETALQSLEDVEVVYFVIDQSAYPDAEYEEMIPIVIKLGKPIFLVVNKLDWTRPSAMRWWLLPSWRSSIRRLSSMFRQRPAQASHRW